MKTTYDVKEKSLSSFTTWKPKKKDIEWTKNFLRSLREKGGQDEFVWATSWYSLNINMKTKTFQWVESNNTPKVIASTMDNLARTVKVLEKIGFKMIKSDYIISNCLPDKRIMPGGRVIDQNLKIPGEEGNYDLDKTMRETIIMKE